MSRRWIFMLMFATAVCVMSVGMGAAAVITVDDSGGAMYTSIQTAIDHAIAGDTIEVNSGTYYENVYVNKQLTLHGIGMPVVDAGGSGSAITLPADGIVLEGFIATRGGSYPGAGIEVYSSNNTLSGNTVSNSNSGIYLSPSLSSSSNNTLSGNTVSNNSGKGIYLGFSSNNKLSGNTVSNNSGNGIQLSSSSNNTLSGNTVSNNNYYGIYLFSSSNNTLSDNTASNNSNSGIRLSSSSNNTLSGNTVSNHSYSGIYLPHSINNTLSGNTASNNDIGIFLYSSSSNTLSGNTVSNNNDGIYLRYSSNNIYNNIFNNTNNVQFYDSSINTWNTTLQSSPNIVGGSYLGGNFWAEPDGTGFSQTCTDADFDGICDLSYTLASDNVDYLPLAVPATAMSPTITVSTDKTSYAAGDTVITTFNFKNPTATSMNTLFVWYLAATDYSYVSPPLMVRPIPLPAGFDQSFNVPIVMPNLGTTGLNLQWMVELRETSSPYNIISEDTTDWQYVPISPIANSEIDMEVVEKEMTKTVKNAKLLK